MKNACTIDGNTKVDVDEIFFFDIVFPTSYPSLSSIISANSSPKIFGPSYKRFEGLSLVEQTELKGVAWYQAGIPREISLEVSASAFIFFYLFVFY